MSDQAIKIKCTAKIKGEERYVTTLHANIGVGGFWPIVTVQTHPKKDAENEAVKLSTSEVAQEMGEIQNKIFESRSSPDCEINVNLEGDDEAGSFEFKGFLTGGSYEFAAGNVGKEEQAIPEYALVSTLTYSIYKQGTKFNAPVKPDFESSFTEFIKQCCEELEKNWKEDPKAQQELNKAVAQKQHEMNQKVKQYWEQLLQESDGDDKFGWQEASEVLSNKKKGGDVKLRQRIMDILLGVDGPFESTIMQIAEEFQLVYIPQWDKIGMFKNKYNLMKDPEDLEVDIIQLHCTGSNGMSLFPIKYVAVVPPQGQRYNDKKQASNFIAYPEEGMKEGGSMLRSHGPLWIAPFTAVQKMAKDGKTAPRREKECDPNKAKEGPQEAADDAKSANEKIYDIFKKWAQADYVFQALSGSQATVCIPLNFNIELGKGYVVKTKKDSTELFTGMLTNIQHTITTGNGKNPQAMTQLTFSNVCFPGFTLPGAD